MSEATTLTLTPDEVEEITGYKRAADQMKALESRGFYRAFLRAGRVVLERAHYEAVCAGVVERARAWEGDSYRWVDFDPGAHSEYVDMRGNQFAKGKPYENDRTLSLGDAE